VKLAPEDLTANLALAAALLRRSRGEAAGLRAAGEQLAVTRVLYGKAPTEASYGGYALLRGLYCGLAGDVAEARRQLQELLAHDAGNADARSALAAIGDR
jgi:hypothetical protein